MMMKNRNILCSMALALCGILPLHAQLPQVAGTQDNTLEQSAHNGRVNFGVKGGFTSSLLLPSDFSINGQRINPVQNNYKIGYFGSFFVRINFGRHFLQPEISYALNRCDITFDLPDDTQTTTSSGNGIAGTDNVANLLPPRKATIASELHSLDIPIIYGYNVIKEEPYSLAVFGGPKLRYIFDKASKVDFMGFEQTGITEELYPLNVSFTAGVAVTISRIFFDFRYDIGISNLSRNVTYQQGTNTDLPDSHEGEIHLHRRDNVLSFSLGIFF